MTFDKFVEIIHVSIGEMSPDIDYIDVDICYDENPVIKVSEGREKGTIKIWAE